MPQRKTTTAAPVTFGVADFIPVPPFRTADGAFPGLVPLLGVALARPVALTDPASAFSNFTVVSTSLSMSLAVSLGIGSIFKGAVGANEKAFYLDAGTFTDQYAQNPLPSGGVYATRWGVGIRVYLRVQDRAANASLNFGLVGAAVELQQANAQYEISGFGIGVDGLIAVLEELPAIGDFKYETYLKINGTIVKKLAAYIKDHKATLTAVPIAVAVARNVDPLANARAFYFGVRAIADRRSLADALSATPGDLDRETVRTSYSVVAQVSNDNERPNRDAQARAEHWLAT